MLKRDHSLEKKKSVIIRKLSEIFSKNDFGSISIVNVECDSKLKNAKVYFTCLSDDDTAVDKKLNAQNSHIRWHLSKALPYKSVPILHFVYDKSYQQYRRIDDLIEKNNKKIPAS